jgi:hypothetical protein
MKKALIGIVALALMLNAKDNINIKVQMLDIELPKYEQYIKVSKEEYDMLLSKRVKELGKIDNIDNEQISNKYYKIIYKSKDNVVAEIIENNVSISGVDLERFYNKILQVSKEEAIKACEEYHDGNKTRIEECKNNVDTNL